jgi:hypothetical protein
MRSELGRNVSVVILGIAVSGVATAAVLWLLARTGVFPVWRLAEIAAEPQTNAHGDVFALLLTLRWLNEWVVGPVVGAVVGVLVGLLSRTQQWLCALIAILPIGITLTGFPAGWAWRVLLVTIVVTVACAHVASLGMRLRKR